MQGLPRFSCSYADGSRIVGLIREVNVWAVPDTVGLVCFDGCLRRFIVGTLRGGCPGFNHQEATKRFPPVRVHKV